MTKKQIFMAVFLFLLFVPNLFVAASQHRSHGRDFRAFTMASDRLMERSFMYQGSGPGSAVTWPLFFAVFMLPLTLLSKVNMSMTQMLWYSINAGLFFLTIAVWCGIVYQKRFDWFDYKKPLSVFSPLIFMPVVFIAGPLLDNAVELQINIFQMFVVSLGLLSMMKKKECAAGLCFGFATAVKVYPAIFLLYLLFRRRFRAAAVLVISAALLTLVPMLWYGPDAYFVNMKAWISISVHGGFPLSGSSQGVYAMVGRYVTQDISTLLFGKVIHPPITALGSQVTIWLHRILFAAVLVPFLVLLRRRRIDDIGFEGAFFMLIMVLFSPVSWKHYYTMIFPVYFILWKEASERADTGLKKILWITFALIPVAEVFGGTWHFLWHVFNSLLSNYTVAGLLLAGAMYRVAARRGTAPSLEVGNRFRI